MEDARDKQGADDADVPDAEPGRSAPERCDRNFVEINRNFVEMERIKIALR